MRQELRQAAAAIAGWAEHLVKHGALGAEAIAHASTWARSDPPSAGRAGIRCDAIPYSFGSGPIQGQTVPAGQGFPAPGAGAGNAMTRPLGCAVSGPP
jgi:hypothetical protein